jgi:hypothetical protein
MSSRAPGIFFVGRAAASFAILISYATKGMRLSSARFSIEMIDKMQLCRGASDDVR